MKVHLIKRQSINEFIVSHGNSKAPFYDWLEKFKVANWKSPDEIKATYSAADLLGNSSQRVVFNIGGNNYRIICKYVFGATCVRLYVCWIGTHADYTILCRRGHQYWVNQF